MCGCNCNVCSVKNVEACFTGEALETIKGLGYSEITYEAAKSRLLRKYSGNRREVDQNETN